MAASVLNPEFCTQPYWWLPQMFMGTSIHYELLSDMSPQIQAGMDGSKFSDWVPHVQFEQGPWYIDWVQGRVLTVSSGYFTVPLGKNEVTIVLPTGDSAIFSVEYNWYGGVTGFTPRPAGNVELDKDDVSGMTLRVAGYTVRLSHNVSDSGTVTNRLAVKLNS